jgi:hypothetical protein
VGGDSEYLGLSFDTWSFIFGGVQAIAVVFAVVFGTHQLRHLRRQRAWDSLGKMLEEWRASIPDQRDVIARMPIHQGECALRASQLAQHLLSLCRSGSKRDHEECVALLTSARETVHALNDVGAFVERGGVDQRDFFGQFHVRVLELAFLLEPFVVLISACRESRWGLRVRRLRIGAERYHRTYRIHRSLAPTLRGHRLIEAKPHDRAWSGLREIRLRWRLVPSKEKCMDPEDRLLAATGDAVDRTLTDAGLSRHEFLELLPVKF